MTHIIDYQATQPINKTGGTTFAIPASPNRAILATIKLRISRRDSRDNRVELIGTVGVKGITDIAQFFLEFFVITQKFSTHK
ncbi:hypothetical protein DJ93_5295 [Bacillus clarus]|uniref:Exosporium protein C n=1 Tax=Bacillus clarus TaxID=2338372 RepID=A0A090YTV5_9BACI|nr:hypothetical protein DJ93_5295 [Bacillus clarus]